MSIADTQATVAAEGRPDTNADQCKPNQLPASAKIGQRVSYDTNCPPRPGRSYAELEHAYAFFNAKLFGDGLPYCLITLQRHARCYGYFSASRFINPEDPSEITDEIALNPEHFVEQTPAERLSTLVHEQTHLWQHHFGKPSRAGYHNREWARKMVSVGLIPSSTGKPGGRPIGQSVSHYIREGGPFDQACSEYLTLHPATFFQDVAVILQALSDDKKPARARKRESKTRYVCSSCGLKAWAKKGTFLICGNCERGMIS